MTQRIQQSPLAEIQNKCALFASLSARHLLELEARDAIRTYILEPGETLLVKGGSGKDAYYLLHGEALCAIDGNAQDLGRYGTRCQPLELADGQEARIEATTRLSLCRADRIQIDYMVAWEAMLENLGDSVEKDIRKKLERLKNPMVFMHLPFENVVKAFEKMDLVEVKAGADVVVQGEAGDRFYIIEAGSAEVWQSGPYDDEQAKVAEIGTGDQFGEEALVTGGSRNATVRMTSDGRLLSLAKADFDDLIKAELVEEVHAAVSKAMMDSGRIMVDVRYEEEWEDGHIEGARLMPLHELRNHLSDLDKTKKYVAYCLSGKRSSVAAMIMAQSGFDTVCMANGLRDWSYGTVSEY